MFCGNALGNVAAESHALCPNGTDHQSPAQSAGAGSLESVRPEGTLHAGSSPIPKADVSNPEAAHCMNRPYRTESLSHALTRHCVPGFDDLSRWDKERTPVSQILTRDSIVSRDLFAPANGRHDRRESTFCRDSVSGGRRRAAPFRVDAGEAWAAFVQR